MRTILTRTFYLAALVLCTLTAMAEENYVGNSDINAQWRKREIKVKGGSKAPSIMTLLKAFQGAMPTWSVGKVIKHGEQIVLGANDNYVALCRKHYKEEKTGPNA